MYVCTLYDTTAGHDLCTTDHFKVYGYNSDLLVDQPMNLTRLLHT